MPTPQSARERQSRVPAFVNARAGRADEAIAVLERLGRFVVERVPPRELPARVRVALDQGARRVLVAGGDGTIGAAADVLRGGGCELAIMPAGTRNHLAQDLAIPLDLEEAARVAIGARTRTIDMAEVNGRPFLNTSSVGAYVSFVRTRDRLERWLGYWIASTVAALRMLVRLRTLRVTVHTRGALREYETALVFIGVGERDLQLPSLGARVRGGERDLHVMVVRPRSRARVAALAFAAAARGVPRVGRTPAMDTFLAESVRVEPRRRRAAESITVDGEIVRSPSPFEYRIAREAVTVVVGA